MRWNLRKPAARRTLWVVIGCLFLMVLAYQVLGANGLMALRQKWLEEREWEARNQALRHQNEALAERVRQLHTDPRAIEKIAREEMKMAGPQDRVIITPEKK